MPDSTINGLTAVTGANLDQTADQLPIWVNSASTTRKISRSEFLSGPPVGTMGSAIRAAASDYAAVTFDGATTSSRISSTLTGQNIGTGDFSLWSRFRVPALAAFASNPGVISLGQSASDGTGNNSFRIILLSGGSLSIRSNDGSGVSTNSDVSGFSAAYSGQVVDIVVTRTGSTVKLYINGTDTAITGTLNGSNSITSTYCHVGIGAAGSAVFSGRIYRSVVFNRALSASDVTELITTGVNPADQWGTQTQIVGYNPAVLNGGFETNSLNASGTWSTSVVGTSTATIDTSGSFSRTGTNAGKLTLDASGSFASFQGSNGITSLLALNKRYRISIWARKGATSGSCGIQFGPIGSGAAYGTSGLVLTTSYANTVVEVVSSMDGGINVGRQASSAALSEIYIDDVEITRIGAIVDLDFTVGGGSTAYDRSTNGLDGTLFGGVSWTMPRDGQYINGPSTITGDLTARNWFVTGGSLPGVGNNNPFAYRIGGGGLGIGAATETGTTAPIVFYAGQGGVEQYRIAPLGVNTWSDGAGGTRMTLNATGLGVGVSPSYKLDVLGSATISGRFKTSGALNALYLEDGGTTPGTLYIGTSGNEFRIVTGSNVALAVDVNRNFAIGPTSVTTTATDGFVYIPVCAGAPTGTPTAKGGRAAFVVDSTNNRFYVYVGGAWKYAALV